MRKAIFQTTFILFNVFVLFSCNSAENTKKMNRVNPDSLVLIDYVNPFIGTKNMGHTFPGATAPYGMVQLSPETNNESIIENGVYNKNAYKYCSGYQYEDSTVFGFSHTHFSGTGHSDLGDFLIMPTTGVLKLEPGKASVPNSGYHSKFSHENESAEPAYYKTFLDDYSIGAELTATERVGFHQYTFQKSDSAHIVLDLMSNIYNHDNKNVWTFVRVENDSTVTGYRQTDGWGRTRYVYFAMKFSKSFKTYGHKKYDKLTYNGFYRKFDEEHNFPEMAGKNLRAYFNFSTQKEEKIKIKFALSSVSTAGALLNMESEIPDWDFEKTKKQTQLKWENELSKIIVKSQNDAEKESFYTSLYHTMLSPVIYEDVDGSYRGLDQNIHQSNGFTNYTVFSLWDTYRALHPLYNLIQPTRNNDMIKSMLAHQNQSVHKMLPIWSHYSNENWCMIGYHSVSVLADAIVKGSTDVSIDSALQACISTSNCRYFDGLGYYIDNGFIPEDKSSSSVSKTLEYSYDDWCIAQIANTNNDKNTSEEYLNRSQSFKNNFDILSGFMKPKLANGKWKKEFDALDTHGQGFIEGNAWNYSLFIPHQIPQMIEMMGGEKSFTNRLDSLFTMTLDDKYIEKNEDITRDGIIGNYVHGNEPGHHIPYLYNWTNSPWKTQSTVRMIMDSMYENKVDGLCGNDDAGQMSAWYIFSSLGFYPVCPGSDSYSIGSPLVVSAEIYLENGNVFKINTVNQGKKNVYIEKMILNGEEITQNQILHSEIMKGGEFTFFMSDQPKIMAEK